MPLNEHVLVAPLLLFFAIGKATAFNFKVFMAATQVFWFLAFWAIYDRLHYRAKLSEGRFTIATLVLSFFWFNWRSSDSIVSGFQLSFLMALSFAIFSCCFLDRFGESQGKRNTDLVLAFIFAVIGSYSTSSGLLAWPVGIVYFVLSPRFLLKAKLKLIAGWGVFSLLVISHYLKLTKESYAAVKHGTSLVSYFRYYFTLLGNHLDHEISARVLGLCAFAFLVITCFIALRRKLVGVLAWELSLLSFPTALAMLMAWGRFHEAPAQALSNRYVICLVIFYVALAILAIRLFSSVLIFRFVLISLGILGLLSSGLGYRFITHQSLERQDAKQRLLRYQELPLSELEGITYGADRVKRDAPFWMKHWQP